MSFNLTELSAIPVCFNQLFKRAGQARVSFTESLRLSQSPKKKLLCLLKIALS